MAANSSLPDDLKSAIDILLAALPKNVLAKAAVDLSKRYRSERALDQTTDFMNTDAHRLAYLAVRMPATYAVIKRVLEECKDRMPSFSPSSIADIGAGPGTASWAAVEAFSQISKVTLLEKDANLLKLGSRLMQYSGQHSNLKEAVWKERDLLEEADFEESDLMILSYVVGELPIASAETLLKKMWKATGQVLIVIEPGTPHGFSRILALRTLLIELGAYLVAPCPHHGTCPMQGGNWCHFSTRLERSAYHREVKDVDMGYEDEKYSYVIASKSSVLLPEARILRHPQVHSGHVDFVLCGQTGLEKKIVSKRMGEIYKKARKLSWGDPFP